MKKLLLMLLMPLTMVSAQAQSNDYNMVIKLNNGTKITLDANDVKDLTFNGDELSISGNTAIPKSAQLSLSLPPLVKNISSDDAPKSSAISPRAFNTACFVCRPKEYTLEGFPKHSVKKGCIAVKTFESVGVVAA